MFNINVLPGTVKREDDESGLEWLGLLRGKRKEPTADVTYFTCLKMMSETLAKMPWKYYQETSKGIKKLKDTDESRLLRIRPNPYMTPTIFWNTVEVNRNHYGNAYVYIQRVFDRKKFGGKIKTTGLWILPSDCRLLWTMPDILQKRMLSGTCTRISIPGSSTFLKAVKYCTLKHHIQWMESQAIRYSTY